MAAPGLIRQPGGSHISWYVAVQDPRFPSISSVTCHGIVSQAIGHFLLQASDYCGPYIKEWRHRNRNKLKTYVAVFVYFVTRVIHLELVSDLTTEAFLASLKRYVALQGKSWHLYLDNAKNFIDADRELRGLVEVMKASTENNAIHRYLNEHGARWHFIPPKSLHFDGLFGNPV